MSRPRVLFVSRERHRLPLPDGQRRKWDALGERFDLRVLAASAGGTRRGDPRFRLTRQVSPAMLDGPLFYAALPFRVAAELRAFDPDVVIAQNVHETALTLAGRAVVRSRARVVLDLHGDWRVATRLYGSPLRRLLNPAGDALGPFSVHRADAVRTLSASTTGLVRAEGVEPAAVFHAFVDLEVFRTEPVQPLPDRPAALFVGVLERYKGFDVLMDAWPRVAEQLPDARLRVIGRGTLATAAAALAARSADTVTWTESLAPAEVASALDEATVLVLPSRSEGLPRVVIEAFCRGRGVVGARAGGIPDIVGDGIQGLLVDTADPTALADGLSRVLGNPALAMRLGSAAHSSASRWAFSPEDYADAVAKLVSAVLTRTAEPSPSHS
jgi:glycosyltransferase involved in cell wall biosynthesis